MREGRGDAIKTEIEHSESSGHDSRHRRHGRDRLLAFAKSFRGFVDYVPEWGGREGLWAGLVILVLPFVVLWMASKLLPLWKEHEHAPT